LQNKRKSQSARPNSGINAFNPARKMNNIASSGSKDGARTTGSGIYSASAARTRPSTGNIFQSA
jgi:hypothetical protein